MRIGKSQIRTKGGVTTLRPKEEDIQKLMIDGLRLKGYTVLTTSRQRRGVSCPKCGTKNFPSKGDGVDKGLPDLMVWHPRWGACWLGLEVKGPETPVSPEQEALAKQGAVQIVKSLEDAFREVECMDMDFR